MSDSIEAAIQQAAASASATGPATPIVIKEDRSIVVPTALQQVAVQCDNEANVLHFVCPRNWADIDLAAAVLYINVVKPDKSIVAFTCTNVVASEDTVTFDWVITGHITEVAGKLSFLVCARDPSDPGDGYRWHSNLCNSLFVAPGIVCTVPNILPDPPHIPLYGTDTTLTEPGVPADAKVVGDKFSKLYEEIGDLSDSSGSGMSSTKKSTLIAVVNAIGAFNVNNGQELIDAFMDAWAANIPATGITLSAASLSFTAGISQSLTATVEPSDSTDTVVWSSSNHAVATVTNGVVTPVANGYCVITATAGSVSAICTVNVAFTEEVVYRTITNNLTNCTSDNAAVSVVDGSTYTANLTASDGYTLDGASVSIVVNGVDVTDIAYSGGVVTIQSVTGNVVIAVEAVSIESESIVYLDYVTLSDGAYFDTGIVASMENKYLIGIMTPEISETQYIWGTKARNNTNLDKSDYYDDVISIYSLLKFGRTVKGAEHFFAMYDSTSMNGINGSDNKLNLVPWYVYMQFDASSVKAYADEEMASPLGASEFIAGNMSTNHFKYALNYSKFGGEITPFDTTKHAPSNVYLGKVNNTLGAYADYATPVDGIKYYVYKVWDKNGNLLMHLKPAKKGTKVGMYDVISSTFLESAEGTVTAGNEVSA